MIELLLIGTTHLNMPNNGDVLMPETADILSPTRQQELDAFVLRDVLVSNRPSSVSKSRKLIRSR